MMSPFETARIAMVDAQVRANDVPNPALQAAMLAVAREAFVPADRRALAYADLEAPIGDERCLLRPRDFAKLAHACAPQAHDIVLDLFAGTGYSTAILARLSETVLAVEPNERLAKSAQKTLMDQGVANAVALCGDALQGLASEAPFQVIFVNGAVEDVPQLWLDQLADGGRLGVFVRDGSIARARLYTKAGAACGFRVLFDGSAPLLPGATRPRGFEF